MNSVFLRTGSFKLDFSKDEIFPLLYLKREEKWIPNWECQVLYSISGFNEAGALFKTEKAFGTELIWYTNVYDKENGKIEFTNFSSNILIFNFLIQVQPLENNNCRLKFTHRFYALKELGSDLIKGYEKENFQERLLELAKLITNYLNKN